MSVDEDGVEALEGEQPPHSRDQSPDKGNRVNDQNKKDSMPINKCFCKIDKNISVTLAHEFSNKTMFMNECSILFMLEQYDN